MILIVSERKICGQLVHDGSLAPSIKQARTPRKWWINVKNLHSEQRSTATPFTPSYLYFEMWKATFPWHTEDMDNIHLKGCSMTLFQTLRNSNCTIVREPINNIIEISIVGYCGLSTKFAFRDGVRNGQSRILWAHARPIHTKEILTVILRDSRAINRFYTDTLLLRRLADYNDSMTRIARNSAYYSTRLVWPKYG